MTTYRAVTDSIKSASGCALCGWNVHPSALHFDHLDPSSKYRNRKGKPVHIADMVKGNRYALSTILVEIAKCRVLCANCHAIHTHTVQR